MTSAELAGLRRAIPSDLDAVVPVQRAAYEPNRAILGAEPLPLQADYAQVLRDYEVWLAEDGDSLAGVLILQPRHEDLLIWSIACDPARQGRGLGARLLAATETRAGQLGVPDIRLYTGQKLAANVAWYGRHGYRVEHLEPLADRTLVHMVKRLSKHVQHPEHQ